MKNVCQKNDFRMLYSIMRIVHTTQSDECGEEEKSKIPCSQTFWPVGCLIGIKNERKY